MHKAFKVCTAVLLALVMTVSLVSGALAVAVRNDDDTISYEPLEQGVYSKGGLKCTPSQGHFNSEG